MPFPSKRQNLSRLCITGILLLPAISNSQTNTSGKTAWDIQQEYKLELAQTEKEKKEKILQTAAEAKQKQNTNKVPTLTRTEAEKKFPEIARKGIPDSKPNQRKGKELSIDDALDLLKEAPKKRLDADLEDGRAFTGTFSVRDLYKYALNDARVKRLRESGYSVDLNLHYDLRFKLEDFYIRKSGNQIEKISLQEFEQIQGTDKAKDLILVQDQLPKINSKHTVDESGRIGLFSTQDNQRVYYSNQHRKGIFYSLRGIPKDRERDLTLTKDEELFNTDHYAFHHQRTFKEKLSKEVMEPSNVQSAIQQTEAAMRKDSLVKVHVFGEFSEAGILMSEAIRIEIAANHGDTINCATRILSRESREQILRDLRTPSLEKTVETILSVPKYPEHIQSEFESVQNTIASIRIFDAPVFDKDFLQQHFNLSGTKPDLQRWRENSWRLKKKLNDVVTWNAENILKLETETPEAVPLLLNQLQEQRDQALKIIQAQDDFVSDLAKAHYQWQYQAATALSNLPAQLLSNELQNTFLPEETYQDRVLVYYRAPAPIMENIDAHLTATLQENAGKSDSQGSNLDYFNQQLRKLSQMFFPYIEATREDYFQRLFSEGGIDYSEKRTTGEAVTHSAYLKGQAILNFVARQRGFEVPIVDENGKQIPKFNGNGDQTGWETISQPGPMYYVRSALDLLNTNPTFVTEFEKLRKTSLEFGFQKVALTVCTRVGSDRQSKVLLERLKNKDQLYAVEQRLPLEVGISINNYVRRKNGTLDAVPRYVNNFIIDTLNPDSPNYISRFSATQQIIDPTIDATRKVEVFLREKIENNKSIRTFE